MGIFWGYIGFASIFALPILAIGIGIGFANHGFKLFEIHKHYHNKEE